MKKRIPVGRLFFTFSLIPTLSSLFFIVLFCRLGFWQLERAEYKTILQNKYLEGEHSAPLSLEEGGAINSDLQHFPVSGTGHFLVGRDVYLDNQVKGGVAGLDVLTPFQLHDGRTFLVDRGWMPLGADRQNLPVSPASTEMDILLNGRIYFPDKKNFILEEDDFSQVKWPLLVQRIDLFNIGEALGVELAPFVIRAASEVRTEQAEPLPKEWVMIVMGPEKSFGYAVQWFGMAFVLGIMYLVFSFRISGSSDD
ncbi:MAG: SURF1 family protein [Pseudomonadales bacterium]|nr:SURF1 family protein [Pseudomonadales bacterium]